MMELDNLIPIQIKLIEVIAKSEGSTLSEELDKLIGLEPRKVGIDFFKGYEIDQYACPKCGRAIGDEMMLFHYCPNCGQKIGGL